MKRILTLSFLLAALFLGVAKENKIDLSSPQKAVRHHLKYLQDNSYDPNYAALSLDTTGVKKETAERLAIKLKQIYDGAGYSVVIEDIPNDSDYLDSLPNHKQKYIVDPDFKDIYVRQDANGEWKYAAECVAQIDEIHKEVYPFGTHLLLDLFSKDGNDKLFGLYMYQYAGLLLIIILCFVFHKVLTYAIDSLLHRLLIKKGLVGSPGTELEFAL